MAWGLQPAWRCRIVLLHKSTLQTVMSLEGLPTGRLPVRAAMDPGRGRWLLAGGEDGWLYCFSLSPPEAGAATVVLPCMRAAVAPGAAAPPGPPIYCVAWSPTMHVAAVCSRDPAGYTTMLCSAAGTAPPRRAATPPELSSWACLSCDRASVLAPNVAAVEARPQIAWRVSMPLLYGRKRQDPSARCDLVWQPGAASCGAYEDSPTGLAGVPSSSPS